MISEQATPISPPPPPPSPLQLIFPGITPQETDGAAYPWILEHIVANPEHYDMMPRPLISAETSSRKGSSSKENDASSWMDSRDIHPAERKRSLPGESKSAGSPHQNSHPNEIVHLIHPSDKEYSQIVSDEHITTDTPTTAQFLFANDIRISRYMQGEDIPSTGPRFKACLMEKVSVIPFQPFRIPPAFVASFVRRCFTKELCLVDFTQAMTALTYLEDLETRRKRELSGALRRLTLDRDSTSQDRESVDKAYPGVAEWVATMEEREKKVEALYTQTYIGLRRWTLINEMRLTPFSKANCLVMLNALYPANATTSPTRQLTPTLLHAHREAFLKYIQAVERFGKSVLQKLEGQSRGPKDHNGWPVVRDIVDKYLRTATDMIDRCTAVNGTEDFALPGQGKRSDSAVSFTSSGTEHLDVLRRPSVSQAQVGSTSKITPIRPSLHSRAASIPADAVLTSKGSSPPTSPTKKSKSTLERLAREIRRIRSRSSDSNDTTHAGRFQPPPPVLGLTPKRSLRKMKSTSAINRPNNMRRVITTPVVAHNYVDRSRSTHGASMSGHAVGANLASSWESIGEAQRSQLIREAKLGKEGDRKGSKTEANTTVTTELMTPVGLVPELSA